MHPNQQYTLAKSLIAERHSQADAHRRHDPPRRPNNQEALTVPMSSQVRFAIQSRLLLAIVALLASVALSAAAPERSSAAGGRSTEPSAFPLITAGSRADATHLIGPRRRPLHYAVVDHPQTGRRIVAFTSRAGRNGFARRHTQSAVRTHTSAVGYTRLYDYANALGFALSVADGSGKSDLTRTNCVVISFRPICLNFDNRTTSVSTSAARRGVTASGRTYSCGGVLLYDGSGYSGSSLYVGPNTLVNLPSWFDNRTSSVDGGGLCTLQQP